MSRKAARACTRRGSTRGSSCSARSGCLARAVFVRAERSAWFFIGAALLATTCGDVLYDFWYGGNPPFPSAADVALPRLLPADLRRDRAPASPARLDLQREPLARRARGRYCGRRARASRACRGGRQLDAREPAGRGHEHRLSARRPAPPRPRGLRLLGHPLASGSRLGADRGRPAAQHRGRRRLPLPGCGRQLCRGHAISISPGRSRSFSSRLPRGSGRRAPHVSSSRTARCSARRSSAA